MRKTCPRKAKGPATTTTGCDPQCANIAGDGVSSHSCRRRRVLSLMSETACPLVITTPQGLRARSETVGRLAATDELRALPGRAYGERARPYGKCVVILALPM